MHWIDHKFRFFSAATGRSLEHERDDQVAKIESLPLHLPHLMPALMSFEFLLKLISLLFVTVLPRTPQTRRWSALQE